MTKTLICTVGSQPQVVTFALDYLLKQGEAINEVVVLHLSTVNVEAKHCINRLLLEFSNQQYNGKPCRFRAIPIRKYGKPLLNIQNIGDADATRQTIHNLIISLKQQGRPLHLCIAGGPRMMALMALSTAMLHCGHQDKIWHMYTQPDFLEQAKVEGLLHDDTQQQMWLLEVPLVPWGTYFSPLLTVNANGNGSTPNDLLASQTEWLDKTEYKRCKAVSKTLTRRQEDVLEAFAEGLNPQSVADKLCISLKTVDTHKTKILAECKIAWDFAEDKHLTYRFLQDKFKTFFN